MNAQELLVVAERTADPSDLIQLLAHRAHAAPMNVALVVPATLHGVDWAGDPHAAVPDALAYAQDLLHRLTAAGVRVRETIVGDPDPRAAIEDALHGRNVAEIVISRAPKRIAGLLRSDLPQRIVQATEAPVTYVRAARVARQQRGRRHLRLLRGRAEYAVRGTR